MDWVKLSCIAYEFLLKGYPAAFRQAFGRDMALTFRDACRDARRRSGVPGLAGLWMMVVPDLAASLLHEHTQEVINMRRPITLRLPIAVGVLGSLLWMAFGILAFLRPAGLPDGDSRFLDDLMWIFFAGQALSAVGLAGVLMGPGLRWPRLSRLALTLAVLAASWTAICPFVTKNFWAFVGGYMAFAAFLSLAGLGLMTKPDQRPWLLVFIGLAVLMVFVNLDDSRVLLVVAAGGMLMWAYLLAARSTVYQA